MKKYTVEELAEILAKYVGKKLTYTDADRERILNKQSVQPYLEKIKAKYADYTANNTISLPFSAFKRFYKDGNRKDGEYWYYYNRRKLGTMALMAWLYGDAEYINALEDILWAIMDEYVWNIPAHVGAGALTEYQPDNFNIDLFSAETCMVIAEIIENLGDKMEPIVSIRARRLIYDRCLSLYDRPFWWKKAIHNWSAVCSGEIGITALYLEKDPAALAKAINTTIECMECHLTGYPNDGACCEGIGYWGYGFGYYSYFADMLYKFTEGEINLFDDEKVKRIAEFKQKCFFKGGKIVTFSDCGGSDSGKFDIPLTMTLNQYFPEITLPEKSLVAFDFGEGASFFTAMKTLDFAPESLDGCSLEAGKTYILPDAQWLMSSTVNGMGLAAKAGHNWEAFEPHNHNDVGSFQIYKNSANLISDIGAGVYSGTYFNHEFRYQNFACSSRGHSVPIIDGEEQRYGEKYMASGTVITEEGGITSDIAGAYELPSLESLVRNVRLDKENECVYVTDTYKFKEAPKSVIERFVSYNQPTIEDGVITISAKGETLTFGYDASKVKPVLRVFEDNDEKNRVRHREGFRAYMVDFEIINPECEFTFELVLK